MPIIISVLYKKIQNKQGPRKTRGDEWGRRAMQPLLPPPPQFNAKQKFFCRNYPISFLFSHKEHLKRVFKASRVVQMQNFKTMMVAVRTAYITAQPAFTCSKLTIETLEQGVKYVQS